MLTFVYVCVSYLTQKGKITQVVKITKCHLTYFAEVGSHSFLYLINH